MPGFHQRVREPVRVVRDDQGPLEEGRIEGAEILGQALGQGLPGWDGDEKGGGHEEGPDGGLEEIDEGAAGGQRRNCADSEHSRGDQQHARQVASGEQSPGQRQVGPGQSGQQGTPQADEREDHVEQRGRSQCALEQLGQSMVHHGSGSGKLDCAEGH